MCILCCAGGEPRPERATEVRGQRRGGHVPLLPGKAGIHHTFSGNSLVATFREDVL